MTKTVGKVAASLGVIVLVVAIVPAYFYWFYNVTLERPNVIGLNVAEIRDSGFLTVRISGLSGQSALSVKDISTQRAGSSVVVLVHLFLARRETSGSFKYDVLVPDSVNEIRFGEDMAIIWQRPKS